MTIFAPRALLYADEILSMIHRALSEPIDIDSK